MSPDLNDTDLERQLSRRADSARLDSEWARFELLPTVRSGMDSRTDGVRSRRLAPIGGVAAIAAVVVLLIVALPRFVPGPQSTADPSPTAVAGPVVLSTQDFNNRLAAGELDGSTVLVDGRIEPGPPLPRPSCLPSAETCFMGVLTGTEPALSISAAIVETTEEDEDRSTIESDEFGWHFWRVFKPPVEGILVLSVNSRREVEYLGRVRAAGAGATWTIDSVRGTSPDSLEVDEVALVDAWLTSEGGVRECPQGFVSGLRQRNCQPSWLVESAAGAGQDGLRVQDLAYYEFAANPSALHPDVLNVEPRHATYAVAKRLEAGPCPGADAQPCWQWTIVGRLTPDSTEAPPPTPEPPTGPPSPTAAPIAARTFECTEPVARIGAVVVDEANIVDSCATVEPSGGLGERDYLAWNPNGEANQIQIEWSGNPCNAAAGWTIRRSPTGFTIEIGPRPDGQFLGVEYQGGVVCIQPLVVHAIRLQLRDEIDATDFAFSAPTTASPTPASPPTPEPLPSRTIDCEGAPTGDVAGAMTLVDHTGLVDECSVSDPVDGDPAAIPSSDPRVLTFEWEIPCATDVSSTVLDFWSRTYTTVGSTRPNYLLIASRSEPKPGSGCLDAIGRRVVQVVPNEPIATEDVEFVLISEGRGRHVAEFDGGYFQLTLTSEQAEYIATEPIEIQAELLYDGTEQSLTLSGVTSLVNGVGMEQLDGPLAMGPGWDLPCVRHEIRSAEPLVFPYVKSASWSPDDPNAGFFQEWVQDPQLRLPAGTWLVTAFSEFAIGSECGGPRVNLEASIVIHVR